MATGHRRVARAVFVAPVEGQKARPEPAQPRGHPDLVRTDGEVHERALLPAEDGGLRVAVLLVLLDRVVDALPGELVLQLGGDDRDAVEEQHEVQLVVVVRVVAELPHDGQAVRFVELPHLGVEVVARLKVREPDLLPGELEAVAQHRQRPARVHGLAKRLEEHDFELRLVDLRELVPRLRLGGLHERDDVVTDDRPLAIVAVRAGGLVTAVLDEVRFDQRLEGRFGVNAQRHQLSSKARTNSGLAFSRSAMVCRHTSRSPVP